MNYILVDFLQHRENPVRCDAEVEMLDDGPQTSVPRLQRHEREQQYHLGGSKMTSNVSYPQTTQLPINCVVNYLWGLLV